MDPVTQGAIGSVVAVSSRRTSRVRVAAVAGFLAGLAADLDVLIRSDTDHLLFLEYHRQFSHSLPFSPIGGFVVALGLYLIARRWLQTDFRQLWLFATIGYLSHGLLDAATSYGTMLLWPISETRYSFDLISIIDPVFSLPVLILLGTGLIRGQSRYARYALVWAVIYLGFAGFQQYAAKAEADALAASRGHEPLNLVVKPTFANTVLWKSIYEHDGRFYVDGIRPSFGTVIFPGTSVGKLDTATAFPWLDPASQQARDVERFRTMSDGFVASSTDGVERVVDVRYSFLPTEIDPLWSIILDRDAGSNEHARFDTHRADARESMAELWAMILGR